MTSNLQPINVAQKAKHSYGIDLDKRAGVQSGGGSGMPALLTGGGAGGVVSGGMNPLLYSRQSMLDPATLNKLNAFSARLRAIKSPMVKDAPGMFFNNNLVERR